MFSYFLASSIKKSLSRAKKRWKIYNHKKVENILSY